MKIIIVFPLLSRPDHSRKVFIYFAEKKIKIIKDLWYQNIYIFSAHIKWFHIFEHFVLLENRIFTKIHR